MIFAMEYKRQRFIFYQGHFLYFKHHKIFFLPKELGPFQARVLNSLKYMEEYLK